LPTTFGRRTPLAYALQEVVLGALSQITERIKLGFGVALKPHEFVHPARAAEKVATVSAVPLTGVHTNKVGVYTLVRCAKSREHFGINRLWDSMWWWYKGFPEAAAFSLLQAQARGEFDITEFDREDMVVVGTPDECLTKLPRYEEAGVTPNAVPPEHR
jgi:alkanesulfonate monooxygenase SsuD/methylene tetrahydromethanopterin reductase-like flavin-dependent oxidoreductase (luciferase family)